MAAKRPTYGVFSDESGHMHGRFRSIAAVSIPAERVVEVTNTLKKVLDEHRLRELKWVKLTRPGGRQTSALRFVEVLVDEAVQGALRADVLVWDTEDARHSVPNRDDIRNYERMFYHLHRSLIGRREGDSTWHLRPDEQIQIDWDTLKQCLDAPGTWRPTSDHPMRTEQFVELLPRIRGLEQRCSHDTPLCQLADPLAGMGRYTREKVSVMRRLCDEDVGQLTRP